MKYILFLFFILNFSIHAFIEDNSSKLIEPSTIDIYHGAFSAKVKEWAIGIDDVVIDVYDFFGDKNSSTDVNNSDKDIHTGPVKVQDKNESFTKASGTNNKDNLSQKEKVQRDILEEGLGMDEFFLTSKLLEERDESYIRVSFVEQFNSLEKEEFFSSVRARLYLGKSRKKFRLFIENFNEDNSKNIGRANDNESPAIGIEKSSQKRFGIKPRYSIGLRGFDAFARARYSYETSFGRWRFEPKQTFTYSIKEEFSEITEFYLDTPTSENTLLRFVVDRGSQSGVEGMHYDGFAQWFYKHRKHAGFNINLGFNGQTKYQNIIVNSHPPLIKEENRVFNYLFLIRWRENIWRKWLFYEIGPGVNYHKKHDYRPNYNIFFGIDLFFGHI